MDNSKPIRVIENHIVPPLEQKVRLSDYTIGLFSAYPTRKSIKKAIKKGLVRVDGKTGHTGTWVQTGQHIELLEAPATHQKPYSLELFVLYEDNFLALVKKPAGLATSGPYYRTLENALQPNLITSKEPDALPRPRVVHRLDALTQGIVLVAKTRNARAGLGSQFEQGVIKKKYECLAMDLCPIGGTIAIPLDGKKAQTIFSRIAYVPSLKSKYLTHLDIYPETGRTHQIRKHLSMIGHPILGDRLYGEKGNILKGKGLFLAALGIQFIHPITGDSASFSLNTPRKFVTRMENEERRWKKYR